MIMDSCVVTPTFNLVEIECIIITTQPLRGLGIFLRRKYMYTIIRMNQLDYLYLYYYY